MPARKPDVARTSLYHLLNLDDLRAAVRRKYFDAPYSFGCQELSLAGRTALLVAGEMTTEKAKWTMTLRGITGTDLDVGNRTAAAVLLIRDGEEDAWALSYGMGFQVLDQDKLDASFGQRIALRSVDPGALSSLTRTTLDARSHVDRLSIPSGAHLRNFGLSAFGELVTRVVAKAQIAGLTDTNQQITVRGADALQLPLARKPRQLLTDLDVLGSLLQKPPLPGLELLEQVVLVRHNPQLIGQLDDRLETALKDPAAARIGAAWPHEQLDENSTAVAFKLQGVGRGNGGPFDGLPTLDDFLRPLAGVPDGQRLLKLRRMKIILFENQAAAATDAVSGAIPALRWLAFETEIDNRRYFLHNGAWYLVDQNYMLRLKQQTREILERNPALSMPDWTSAERDEAAYNAMAAATLGAVNLDRRLIQTEFHRHGIEPCDLLMSDGTMIHVKMLRGSDAASHLIAQALVSADALLHDREAIAALTARITGTGAAPPSTRLPKRVVLAVADRRDISVDTLFTFTQVTLVRNVQALQRQGVEVYVAPIRRT